MADDLFTVGPRVPGWLRIGPNATVVEGDLTLVFYKEMVELDDVGVLSEMRRNYDEISDAKPG